MTRLLLVSPCFHGYWKSVESAFAQLGHEVRTHCYDAAPRAEKAWNKVRYELLGRLRGRREHLSPQVVTQRSIDVLREFKPDVVLVIRGDSLTDDFWAAVDDIGAKRVLWLYDEIRRMAHARPRLAHLAPIVTYSHLDHASLTNDGVQSIWVPNAFDPDRVLPPARPLGEISFVGARLPKREALLTDLAQRGLPVRAYGRDWSSAIVDRARTWRVRTPPVPNARDVALEQAWAIMRDSVATINIHGDQDGFTMRTFEACGVGGVQLIDRPDVTEFYDPGTEVLVFTTEGELAEQAGRAMSDHAAMRALREAARRRTLAEHTFVHRARAVQTLWA